MKKFVLVLILTLVIGITPSFLIGNDVSNLVLPNLYPPKILFPIVWTILYIIMSITVTLATKDDDTPFIIYFIQLVVNSLWTVIFFFLKLRLLAAIWIGILIILVITMIYKFYQKNKLAGLLNIPYLMWLIFALYLNVAIYLLNR